MTTYTDRQKACIQAVQDGLMELSSVYVSVTDDEAAQFLAYLESTSPVAGAGIALLTEDHEGMRVDYSGMFKQARAALARGVKEPALAEMLRQLQDHITELGARWYAGDTAVVDELLQLYCVEKDARVVLAAATPATATAPSTAAHAGATLTDDLKSAFRDAYAAFKGAFDTPQMRMKIPGEYADDARRRLREFDELLAAAKPVSVDAVIAVIEDELTRYAGKDDPTDQARDQAVFMVLTRVRKLVGTPPTESTGEPHA